MAQRYLLAGARGGQGTTTVATVLALMSARHRQTVLTTGQVDDVCALTGTLRPESTSTTPICPNLLLTSAGQTADAGLGASTGRVAVGGDGDGGVVRNPDETPGQGGPVVDGLVPEVQVVDVGRLRPEMDRGGAGNELDMVRWLVVRGPCYLSLRAAVEHHWADGVILLVEPGRSLSAADVADVLGVPVVAQIPVEPAVARVIDAGLLLGRLRRLSAFRSLAQLVRAPWPCERPSTTPAAP